MTHSPPWSTRRRTQLRDGYHPYAAVYGRSPTRLLVARVAAFVAWSEEHVGKRHVRQPSEIRAAGMVPSVCVCASDSPAGQHARYVFSVSGTYPAHSDLQLYALNTDSVGCLGYSRRTFGRYTCDARS